jgi:putative acetyltransferase
MLQHEVPAAVTVRRLPCEDVSMPSAPSPSPHVLIRPAEASDHGALVRLWRDAVEATHHFLTADDVDFYERQVASYLPQMTDLRVAEEAGRGVVGFVALEDGVVEMLFVDPAVHGRGVGTQLLEDAARGLDVVEVDVNEQNPSARAFYRARGFEERGRSEHDAEGRPFPLLRLRREG